MEATSSLLTPFRWGDSPQTPTWVSDLLPQDPLRSRDTPENPSLPTTKQKAMAYASIHFEVSSGCSAALADYECRKNWTEADYSRKNQNENNNYDYTRRGLNFTVKRNPEGTTIATDVNPDNNTKVCFDKRLKELGFKAYKDDAMNQPNNCVSVIITGDHEHLTKLAYGDQDISFEKGADNSHVRRSRGIEQWACDSYDWACEKWGEDNIVGFQVHMDEKTPHIHLTFIPVAYRKQRGRVKPGTERKSNLKVSYKGLFGETLGERSKYCERVHTDYHKAVGAKYGLKRGRHKSELTEEEARERKHKSKALLTAENEAKAALLSARQEEEKIKNKNATFEGIKQGVSDFFTGKARKKAEEADKRAVEAEEKAREMTDKANERADKAEKENSELKEKLQTSENTNKTLSDEVNALKPYKSKAKALDKTIEVLSDKILNITKYIANVLPEAQKYGLSTAVAIQLCSEQQVSVETLKVGEDTFSDKKGFILKWVDGIKVYIGSLLQKDNEKDIHWIRIEEWAKRMKDYLGTKKILGNKRGLTM